MGGSSTTTQSSAPWKPIRPYIKDAAGEASRLYQHGKFAPAPYQGPRVAGFGDVSQQSQQMMQDVAAGGSPLVDNAQSALGNMMNGGWQSQQLQAAQNTALGAAIPAAVSMFSGSGMTNSSAAMDTVGRAAMDAVAPYSYGAMENAQNRALQAAGMAPDLQRASYLPAQMMGMVGGAQDAMAQQMIDAQMGKYYEQKNRAADNLSGYLGAITPMSSMGGNSKSTTTENPGIGDILGTGLQSLALLGML